MLHGPEATIKSVGVNNFESQPKAVAEAVKLGKMIFDVVTANKSKKEKLSYGVMQPKAKK